MIIPNLLVRDIHESLKFYRGLLGMELMVLVSPTKEVSFEGDGKGAAFASLEWKADENVPQSGGQLMLQTAHSLSEELSDFSKQSQPTASGTIYFRGFDPDKITKNVPDELIIKEPFEQWYGMKEVYLKDPDGYIICFGIPYGQAPE